MKEKNKTILILEDDYSLNQLIGDSLKDNYNIINAYTINEAFQKIKQDKIDLFILDINLPDGSGKDVALRINQMKYKTPFIFLTVNDLEEDFLTGYAIGASDYITKPFSEKVLKCKIDLLLYRNDRLGNSNLYIYRYKDLYINFSQLECYVNNINIVFSPTEFKLLNYFVKNRNILVSKEQILKELWDIDGNFIEEHTLVSHISRIRKKIQIGNSIEIKTVYGLGYMFVEL